MAFLVVMALLPFFLTMRIQLIMSMTGIVLKHKQIYKGIITPMPFSEFWPDQKIPIMLPPLYKVKAGRPQKVRRKSRAEIEDRGDPTRLRRRPCKVRCGKCGEPDHNKKECKKKIENPQSENGHSNTPTPGDGERSNRDPKKRDKLPVIRKRLGKQSWVPPSKPPPYKEPWLPPSPHLVHKEVPLPPPTRIYGSTTSISQISGVPLPPPTRIHSSTSSTSQMARVPHAFAEMSSPFMHQSESSPSLEGTTTIKKGGKLYISLKNLKSAMKSSINLKK